MNAPDDNLRSRVRAAISAKATARSPVRRTWYRKQSDGTFFRNCPLIMAEREEALRRRQFRRCEELNREWDEVFRRGVTVAVQIGPDDEWVDFDDSTEATERWVEKTLAGRIERQTRGGATP